MTSAASANIDVDSTLTTTFPDTNAGAHSNYVQNLTLVMDPPGSHGGSGDDLRRLVIDYPAGLIGDPNAIPSASRCNTVDYNGGSAGLGVPSDVTAGSGSPDYSSCPPSSVVGEVSTNVSARATVLFIPVDCNLTLTGSIYLLRNRPNADPEVPTYLGIHVSGSAGGLCSIGGTSEMDMTARITVRPDDQGLRITIVDDLPRSAPTNVGTAQIRLNTLNQTIYGMATQGTGSTADDKPFLTNPTRCSAWTTKYYLRAHDGNSNADVDLDPTLTGNGALDHLTESATLASPNCSNLASYPFNPTFSIAQSNTQAGRPVGLRATLDNPVSTTTARQPSYPKIFSMALPEGFKINPVIANRLGAAGCTDAQFNVSDALATPTCPASSQIGTTAVTVPEITGDLLGKMYLGDPQPGDAAAGIYRLYLQAVRGGVGVKFQGRAVANETTGQVSVNFGDPSYSTGLPQFNYSKFVLDFDTNSAGVGSPGAVGVSNPNDNQQMLTNPQTCGTYSASTTITPWTTPTEAAVVRSNNLTVTAGSNGSCSFNSWSTTGSPSFSANVSDTGAGKHPNLNLTVTRPDRSDNLRDMTFRLPDGFAGAATAVTPCSAANAAAATCPVGSQVGTVTVLTGSGPETASLPGTVYLTDPGPGDTAKLAIIVPAVVGPFNLGNVTIYSALRVAGAGSFRLDAITTNMPQSIKGIPILYRSIALSFNGIIGGKPFLQNPSKCQALNFQATLTSNGDFSGSGTGAGSVQTVVLNDNDQTITGCPTTFNPSVTVTPTSTQTAAPTGMTIGLTIPQTTTGVTGSTVQQSTLNRMQIAFPAGMEFNPAFASAITACPTATVNTDIANQTSSCAATAKVADVTVTTPLLSSTLSGSIYLEAAGSTAATRYKFVLYLSLPGGMQIVRGSATVNGSSDLTGGLGSKDSGTGQISVDFPGLPDVPYSSLSVAFNSSPSLLVNADSCGTQTFGFTLNPTHGGTAATRNPTFSTSYNGSGSSCPAQDPWNPTFSASVNDTTANAHPNLTMVVTRPDKDQYLRDATFGLPAGLTGAATASATCAQAVADAANCTTASQLGTITATVGSGATTASLSGTLHNTVAPANAPAKLTAIVNVVLGPFNLGKMALPVNVSMRANDYGLDATVANLPARYEGIRVRYRTITVVLNGMATQGTGSTADDLPFLTNPSKCGVNTFNASLTSTLNNSVARTATYSTTGCPLDFGTLPTFTATPTTTETQAPTGMNIVVTSAATNPTIKRVRVQFPSGMTINPAVGNSGANTTCSTALIDLGGSGCPALSNKGTVSIQTPLLSGTFTGNVYLEDPGTTAATRYKLAMVVALPGRNLIIRGSATVDGSTDGAPTGLGSTDSGTGQIVADFDNLPDLAWSNMTLNLSSGSRALLINPANCGSQTVNGQITPNSGGTTFSANPTYTTTADCSPPFNPTFSASLSTSAAGANPNLTLNVSNPTKSRQLRNLNLHLPVGLVADTVSTPRCSQANATAGTCAGSSAVGTVSTSIGNSGETLALSGTIHNVTPNTGEPARLQAVIPVLVGPYNLGKLSIPVGTQLRSDFGIDTTTQLPTKYEGIEVRLRSLQIVLNGSVSGNPFMINPTKCQTTSIGADMVSADSATVSGSQSITINGCPKQYGTAPTFSVTPSTTETAKPVGLTFGLGSTVANPTTESIGVTFPQGVELNPAAGNSLVACSTAQINAGGAACLATTANLGTVTLNTPLLPTAQTGNVFLETPGTTSTTRYRIAMVVHLPGTDLIIRGAVNLNGSTTIAPGGTGSQDTGTGQISTVFSGIPDLGFTNIQVAFNSGNRALFTNPRSCASTSYSAAFTPHGGGTVANASSAYTTTLNCSDSFAPTFSGNVSNTTPAGNPNLTLTVNRPEKDRNLRNLTVSLPTGLVAATTATTQCAQATATAGNCSGTQAVGTVNTTIGTGGETLALSGTIYNVVPNSNEPARLSVMVPVQVGPFDLGKLTIPVSTSLRADYGIDATAQLPLRYEGIAVRIQSLSMVLNGTANGNDFIINPSKCQSNTVGAAMVSETPTPNTVNGSWNFSTSGCPVNFGTAPTLSVTPSPLVAGEPTGLTIAVNSNANNPTIKRVQLAMPTGMEVNPAFANGLVACSTANVNAGTCNAADSIADVTMTSHLLSTNPTGKVYLETPGTTASDRYKLAMIIDLPGRKLVVRGSVTINGSTTIPGGGTGSIDSGTGQIIADFDNIPDLGFTNLTMAFESGPQAMVVNPTTCSSATFQGTITPNSGGNVASPTASYTPTSCSSAFDPTFTASLSTTQAAGHPNLTLSVTNPDKNEQLRNLSVQLPTGLVANTTATATRCSQVNATAGNCAVGEEVGTFQTSIGSGTDTYSLTGGKIYNVVPNSNEPARLQAVIPVNVGPFDLGKLSIPIGTSLRSDMGVTATTQLPLRYEGIAVRLRSMQIVLNGTVGGNSFMTNPSKCQAHTITGQMTSAQSTANTDTSSFTTTGCTSITSSFSPTISASVNPNTAGTPTALTFGVTLPAQSSTTNRVQLTLPAGMEISPGVGNGLVACSASQIDAGGAACQSTTANLGSIQLTTPLLAGTQTGTLYLETPGSTATDRYKMAMVINLPGRDLIIRGGALINGSSNLTGGLGAKDSGTGQVVADFPNLPDLGFTNMTVAFASGGNKLLVNPKTCATHTVSAAITPNSGATQATPTTTFSTVNGTCSNATFAPTFSGSISNSQSASNPDLNLQIANPNGTQELKSFAVRLPVGLVANTTAVPRCSQANADAGNCVAANQVGTVTTTIGSGTETYPLSGTIYNVTPNSNQPARLQAIVPVAVGPFDLGKLSIPVPTSLNSDLSVNATATLPSRYEGIAVRMRSMNMTILGEPNGNKFMVAPSKCGAKTVSATMTSDTNTVATGSFGININGCPTNFGSSPTLQVTPSTTVRSTPVDLTFGVTSSATNPTIGRVQVAMPAGLEINPGFGNNLQACSTASIDAGGDSCPAQSQVGTASLKTQLLDPTTSYTGKVFLETPGATASTRFKLALIVELPGADLIVRGQVLVNGSSDLTNGLGSKDSGTGQITADFNNIPDLGFTELQMAFSSTTPMLVNPKTCSSNTFTATISPSSGGSDASPTAAYSTTPVGCSAASFAASTSFSASVDDTTVGAHPNLSISFDRTSDSAETIKDFDLELPVGLVASTTATDHCSQANAALGNCSVDEQVGEFATTIGSGATGLDLVGQIYNVTPDSNEPARLAAVSNVVVGPYNLGKLVIPIQTQLRSDLGVNTFTDVPTRYEGIAVNMKSMDITLYGFAGPQSKPFISNPSKCQSNTVTGRLTPAVGTQVTKTSSFTTTGCPRGFQVAPTLDVAVAPSETTVPTALSVTIGSDPVNSTISRIQVALPPSMSINPAVGNYGAGMTCSTALINAGGTACPVDSRQGTVEVTTPLLGDVQTGFVYLEDPGATADTRYRLAVVVKLPGADMIVRGAVKIDGSTTIAPGGSGSKDTGTGQITTDFDSIPDLAFSEMKLEFNTGPRALLTNPDACGSHTVNATITPSSGGSNANINDSFTTSFDGAGAPCPSSVPFNPTFTAAAADYSSGANTDLELKVDAGAKNAALRNFDLQLPAGLVADTTATTRCSQLDAANGDCTVASQVGTVTTKLGTGSETLDLSGEIHNVVPDADEPARLAAIMPIIVGPYDLGVLSIDVPTELRASDYGVNANTQIPARYEGIQVRIKQLQMNLEGDVGGNGFIKNPSKCQTSQITAVMTSANNDVVTDSVDYTTNGCPIDFATDPTLTVSGTEAETAVPTGLTLDIDSDPANSSISSIETTLPAGMSINPAVGNGIEACSTAAIDAGGTACPAASEIGSVSLVTPLLPGTQTGKVFLETPGSTGATRYKLAVVVDLPGTNLVVRGTTTIDGSSDLTDGLGSTNSGSGDMVASFPSIPDLGFTSMTIAFDGGSDALFVNPETCGTQTVGATFSPHSGGADASASDSYTTDYDGNGASCPGSEPFNPSFSATFSTTQAAGNPDVTLTATRADKTEQLKEFNLDLPPGLVADTVQTQRCDQTTSQLGNCAPSTRVGTVTTAIGTGSETLALNGGLYNVVPDNDEPARLAAVIDVQVGPYNLGKLSIPVTTEIVTGTLPSDLAISTKTTIPSRYEGIPVRVRELNIQIDGIADQGTPSTSDDKPFMINPSQCSTHTITANMKSIQNSAVAATDTFTTTDCATAPYNPTIEADLSTTEVGKPVGLDLAFVFSGNSSSTKSISTAFPAGMDINPGIGNGVASCPAATIDAGGAGCPAGSKLGEVKLDTPLLPTQQTGAIYLETPGNTAATRYKLGIFIDLPGSGDLVVHGRALVDGSSDVSGGMGSKDTGTGQVTAEFDDLPDLQFSRLEINFKTTGGSDHALLTNPTTCGTFDVDAELSPWSRPLTTETASDSFTTSYDGAAAACPGAEPQNPSLDATLSDYTAGASADLDLTISRPDKDQGIRKVKIMLPVGLVGSAAAAPTCLQADADTGDCETTEPGSRIGDVDLKIGDSSDTFAISGGLYNTVAPSNRPAKFTFSAAVQVGPFDFGKISVPVDVNLNGDYSIYAETGNMPQRFEGIPVRINEMRMALNGIADQATVSTADDKPFLSNPRSCSATLAVEADITSPGNNVANVSAALAGPFTGCGNLNLNDNSVFIENVNKAAEQPTALNVEITQGTSATQATMKDVVIDLPGFRLNAPAANGLNACSASDLNAQTCRGTWTFDPNGNPTAPNIGDECTEQFNPGCNIRSKVGRAWIDTSLLPVDQVDPSGDLSGVHSLWGNVYLETPGTAPDGSDRYKLAIQLSGKTLITIRGVAKVNETTGEISTEFTNLPDIPFEKFRVELTGATNPLLLNPVGTVGAASQVTAASTMTSHAGTAPATRTTQLDVDAANAKTFTPDTAIDLSTTQSGAHPDARFTITRADGQEDIRNVSMSLPQGFLGSAAAVPQCSLANASAGTCSSSSKVGTVQAKIGQAGQVLTLPGEVFLTAGVGSDIAGMSIKVPAIAGPYNLGDFITQGRIVLRPSDHGISVDFNDVPKLFKGVPTHIQELRIDLPGVAAASGKPFLFNASSCSPFNIVSTMTPYTGADATSNIPYQATGCPVRGFAPTISFAASGPSSETIAPAWTIKLAGRENDSTLKSATVVLPTIMTVNVQGIGTVCEPAQANARACPSNTAIGTTTINTPLLPAPVTGNVFVARSISGSTLPDLLIEIPAPIDMQIRGANKFINQIQIQSTFDNLPDLIWSEMTMQIAGGPKGLIGLRSNGKCGSAQSTFGSHSGQAMAADSPVTGIDVCGAGLREICENPTVVVSTKGARKPKNKKSSTSITFSSDTRCAGIKSFSVLMPKGTKVNKKQMLYNKKKKATKKNLKNIVGKFGSKRMQVTDYQAVGSNGLKLKGNLPDGVNVVTMATKNSTVLLPYKTLCGNLKKTGKTKAKYKKCMAKDVIFTFVVTRYDGTAFRFNYKVKAGDKRIK